MVACGTAHQEATLCFDTHRASPYLLFFFIFSSAMHALGDILRAHRNEGASTSLGVSYIACHMVLLYRFHDMDSMRDPHIYCNQHSDQNMACVINMVGCHGQQSPPGASAYLTAIVITGSTGGCRNYGVYAAGATGLWSGWWSWYQWYYYFGGAGGHTTKAHMWFYRGYSSAYNSAVNYQLWPIQLAELESKVAEHGEKKKGRRNTF